MASQVAAWEPSLKADGDPEKIGKWNPEAKAQPLLAETEQRRQPANLASRSRSSKLAHNNQAVAENYPV